ncbi:MAG: uroporphyrinogen-III C-methyltransferase [Planctomycetota bacterium]
MGKGLVTLVGAGPGDPELITLRGVRALEEADVVVYDRLAAPELLARARADAELVDVGKTAGRHKVPQDEINAILVRLGLEGKRVARLKGGDPFLFGRGGEEIAELAEAGVAFEVVPGVTAAFGAAAYSGMPLTVRGVSSHVTLVTGHEDPTKGRSDVDWGALARAGGTLVVYMGVGRLDDIASALTEGGRPADTPAAVVRRATTSAQRGVQSTLADIGGAVREAGIKPPALLIVGQAARLEERMRWFESLPLFGRKIVVTRSRKQASGLVKSLRALGGNVMELPTIEIAPPEDSGPLDAALRSLGDYAWICFTSVNAVASVGERLRSLGLDARSFAGTKVAVIGTATAEALAGIGLRADLVPEKFTAEGLLGSFDKLNARDAAAGEGMKGARVLISRAKEARDVLPDGLAERGAVVDIVEAYRTVRPELDGPAREGLDALTSGGAELVTFTSSSTAKNLAALLDEADKREAGKRVPAASIGPITTKTARELGFDVATEAEPHTVPALVEAIEKHFAGTGPLEEGSE